MTEIENAKREMTFEEEAALFEQEARELFSREKPECEPPEANCVVRRGMRIIRKARDTLREKQEREQNTPLTLEELRRMAMDGGMAWCVDTDGVHPGLLCFVECVLDDGKETHIWLLDEDGHTGRYNVRCMLDCGAKFYRRPPEQ